MIITGFPKRQRPDKRRRVVCARVITLTFRCWMSKARSIVVLRVFIGASRCHKRWNHRCKSNYQNIFHLLHLLHFRTRTDATLPQQWGARALLQRWYEVLFMVCEYATLRVQSGVLKVRVQQLHTSWVAMLPCSARDISAKHVAIQTALLKIQWTTCRWDMIRHDSIHVPHCRRCIICVHMVDRNAGAPRTWVAWACIVPL